MSERLDKMKPTTSKLDGVVPKRGSLTDSLGHILKDVRATDEKKPGASAEATRALGVKPNKIKRLK